MPHPKLNLNISNDLVGKGFPNEKLNDAHQTGFTLFEILICTFLITILAGVVTQTYGSHIAQLQLNEVTHAFIQDAQLTRQLSRQLNTKITLQPLDQSDPQNWSKGWRISRSSKTRQESLIKAYSIEHSHLNAQVHIANHLLKDSQQFTDMSAPKKARHISFTQGEPALLHNGGFVANRIIWQHKTYPALVRHVILGPGGRWRICNPQNDYQKCL